MKKKGSYVSRENKIAIAAAIWKLICEPKHLRAWTDGVEKYVENDQFQPNYPEYTVGYVKWWILKLGGYI